MTIRMSGLRVRLMLCGALAAAAVALIGGARQGDAQGLVKGVEQGAREGSKAAGPVGGVLGGAIGGVVGVVTGVTGVLTGNDSQPQPTAPAAGEREKRSTAARTPKVSKTARAANPGAGNGGKPITVLTQEGVPQLTAEQIVANNDTLIDRIKKELSLTTDQEKNWGPFASAMHYLGHNGADRVNLRIARAKRDPPDDIIEQMRNEAQFLVDRAADQRNVADAAEPLYASLDDRQKQIFIDEMVRLSHERGLD